MINYSIAMMANPAKPEEPKKAYGVAQYTEKMTLTEFSKHISDHNCVYDAEDVQAILGKAMKCLREMLLEGKKVEMGKLGEFAVSLQGKGTETAKTYNPANCVEKVNVVWTPGKSFENLKDDVAFNLVACRKEQKDAIKKAKEQDGSATEPGGSEPDDGDDTTQGGGTEPGTDPGDGGDDSAE